MMKAKDLVVEHVRNEVRALGLTELTTPAAVDRALGDEGTTLVFVNSLCGCAGGIMRPALREALSRAAGPEARTTVFAGQDTEATERAREYLMPYPPSSPSLALVRAGQPIWMLSRSEIEGRSHASVADDIVTALQEHCG